MPVVISGSSTGTLSSPHKKYRLGQPEVLLQHNRQQDVLDNSVNKTVSLPQVLPTNDHSITAILSGGESSSPPIVVNNKSSPVPYRHHTSSSSSSSSSRKRSAVETMNIAPIVPLAPLVPVVGTTSIDHNARMSTMVIPPPSVNASVVNDPSIALTALHQLPTLHLPNVSSSAAADYFNVLYHQVAMAAIAYQTHPQLSKLQAPPSSLLSSQYPSVPPSVVAPRMIQQQYHPAPMVQQQQRPLPYQHKLQQRSSVATKKKTLGAIEYDGGIEANNLAVVAAVDEESSSSTGECPL